MIARKASYYEDRIANCFEDAVNIVKDHAETVGSIVKKIYQTVTDEQLETLFEINENVIEDTRYYSFDGIKDKYMITYPHVRKSLLKKEGRKTLVSDTFTLLTKPVISPYETDWYSQEINVDTDQIKKTKRGYIWSKS